MQDRELQLNHRKHEKLMQRSTHGSEKKRAIRTTHTHYKKGSDGEMTTLQKAAAAKRLQWQAVVDALSYAERRRKEIIEALAAKPAKDWEINDYAEEQARGAALTEVTEVLRRETMAADRAVLVDELEKATVKADKAKAAYLKAHKALEEVQREQRALANRGRDYAGMDVVGIEKAKYELDVREAEAKRENSKTDRLKNETGRARLNAENALKTFDEKAV